MGNSLARNHKPEAAAVSNTPSSSKGSRPRVWGESFTDGMANYAQGNDGLIDSEFLGEVKGALKGQDLDAIFALNENTPAEFQEALISLGYDPQRMSESLTVIGAAMGGDMETVAAARQYFGSRINIRNEHGAVIAQDSSYLYMHDATLDILSNEGLTDTSKFLLLDSANVEGIRFENSMTLGLMASMTGRAGGANTVKAAYMTTKASRTVMGLNGIRNAVNRFYSNYEIKPQFGVMSSIGNLPFKIVKKGLNFEIDVKSRGNGVSTIDLETKQRIKPDGSIVERRFTTSYLYSTFDASTGHLVINKYFAQPGHHIGREMISNVIDKVGAKNIKSIGAEFADDNLAVFQGALKKGMNEFEAARYTPFGRALRDLGYDDYLSTVKNSFPFPTVKYVVE